MSVAGRPSRSEDHSHVSNGPCALSCTAASKLSAHLHRHVLSLRSPFGRPHLRESAAILHCLISVLPFTRLDQYRRAPLYYPAVGLKNRLSRNLSWTRWLTIAAMDRGQEIRGALLSPKDSLNVARGRCIYQPGWSLDSTSSAGITTYAEHGRRQRH
jgi:hypothetical protein